MSKTYKIAAIPGDGIGNEVVPAGLRVLEAAAKRHGFALKVSDFDWSCERFAKTGRMMPEDGLAQLKAFDSIYLGAVGYPGVPDHVSLWGLLIPIRRGFHQYINLRPIKLLAGIETPLKNRAPGETDFYVVRENNEGEYSEIGGRLFAGTEMEMAMQQAVFTRTARRAAEFGSCGDDHRTTDRHSPPLEPGMVARCEADRVYLGTRRRLEPVCRAGRRLHRAGAGHARRRSRERPSISPSKAPPPGASTSTDAPFSMQISTRASRLRWPPPMLAN